MGKTVFIPLFFAFLVAMLLYPMCSFLEKHRFPRGVAAILAVLSFILVIGALVWFFSAQVISFSKDLPRLQSRFTILLNDVQDWFSEKYHIDDAHQRAYINQSANGMISGVASSIGTTFVGILEFVILTIFFFIFTFFILVHRTLLVRFVRAFFTDDHSEKVNEVILKTRKVINNYLVGLMTEMLILVALNITVLMVMGIKYALLLGVLAAVLNIIPYLGIYTSIAIGMLITLANGTATQALQFAIALIVVHFIDANVILPRIVGGRVKMNPLITIIAVLIGRLVWGIPGMFLFIPLTAIIRIVSARIEDMKP
ncbi:MAG TPA: AI-2E family transporter, partial [Chitinophagaceae bacterium]|nr:AI-2E family transporter [Chitinophagaceae bacterium]